MSNKIRNALFDLVVEDILDQSSDDLKQSYDVEDLKETKEYKSTKSIIDNALNQHKKNKLITAREHINRTSNQIKKNTTHKSNLMDKLVKLMSEGYVSNELSMAFRDGENMPEEELESLIEDIEELKLLTEDD